MTEVVNKIFRNRSGWTLSFNRYPDFKLALIFFDAHKPMMYRKWLILQTVYYLITSIWALADIHSFMRITGPKTDIWLVKTVAVLLVAISFSFIASLKFRSYDISAITLAVCCCLLLTWIDCFYVWKGTISKVYLLDAVVEICLLVGWLIIIIKRRITL